jgi:hypothetical protein
LSKRKKDSKRVNWLSEITQANVIQFSFDAYHTKCIVNRNNPGTTKSSEPTDQRRRKIITPGILKWKRKQKKELKISWHKFNPSIQLESIYQNISTTAWPNIKAHPFIHILRLNWPSKQQKKIGSTLISCCTALINRASNYLIIFFSSLSSMSYRGQERDIYKIRESIFYCFGNVPRVQQSNDSVDE